MKTIKILRDILIAGEHCEAGRIMDAPDRIAVELIASGSAQSFSKPEKSAPESATMDPTETATMPAPKKRGK